MFTGLIEDIGEIASVRRDEDGALLRIRTKLAPEIRDGDSVAVNGVCLTATEVGEDGFAAEAMNQTLAVTSLGPLDEGDRVNLELAMRASDRLGGHIVQGHVDGVGEITSVTDDGFARRVEVALAPELMPLAVDKGSITLDGVSLTISSLEADRVEVSLIPETLERTTLGDARPGRRVNVESDVIAKYVQRLMSPWSGKEVDHQ